MRFLPPSVPNRVSCAIGSRFTGIVRRQNCPRIQGKAQKAGEQTSENFHTGNMLLKGVQASSVARWKYAVPLLAERSPLASPRKNGQEVEKLRSRAGVQNGGTATALARRVHFRARKKSFLGSSALGASANLLAMRFRSLRFSAAV